MGFIKCALCDNVFKPDLSDRAAHIMIHAKGFGNAICFSLCEKHFKEFTEKYLKGDKLNEEKIDEKKFKCEHCGYSDTYKPNFTMINGKLLCAPCFIDENNKSLKQKINEDLKQKGFI